MADSKSHCVCIKHCTGNARNAQHRFFGWFLAAGVEELWLKLWASRSYLHTCHRRKRAGSLQNRRRRLTKCHCGDHWLVRPLVWHMPGSPEGEFEDAADLTKVFASVAHRPAEAVTVLAPQNMDVVPHFPYLDGMADRDFVFVVSEGVAEHEIVHTLHSSNLVRLMSRASSHKHSYSQHFRFTLCDSFSY